MIRIRFLTLFTFTLLLGLSCNVWAAFTPLIEWDETAVRKVLHTFAYGGFASDEQIENWSEMSPELAIQEILTFDAINPRLSPIQDSSARFGASLRELQDFWGSNSTHNPVRLDKQAQFQLLYTNANGEHGLSTPHLQTTWVQAVATRGLNPFLHQVGFYLTNYHMAITIHKTRAGLMRDFYDRTILALQQDKDFFDVLAQGATSAAVAQAYGHQWNRFNNYSNTFFGNDDFAREFHQLFFRIQGTTEDQAYHENTTIEHTAWALTGMRLDRSNPYGSDFKPGWLSAPIDFSNHSYTNNDGTFNVYNMSWHHRGDLEILHTPISGKTAEEKIFSLARVAGYHPESLNNIPVTIVDYFADDNLNTDKIAVIRSAWKQQVSKSLLTFLRTYATSTTFHREDTVKYRTAFARNLIIQNMNTIDNTESFARHEPPIAQMRLEGAEVFVPAHDVFGGQSGLQAANNPNIFKDAYKRNVLKSRYLARTSDNDAPALPVSWEKDWAKLIHPNGDGEYEVKKIAKWLWRRFIGDGGKNFKIQERAHVYTLLATGLDLGYVIDPTNPERAYTNEELDDDPIKDIIKDNEKALMALNGDGLAVRREANRRIGLAVNFITMTPFMFAMEGK